MDPQAPGAYALEPGRLIHGRSGWRSRDIVPASYADHAAEAVAVRTVETQRGVEVEAGLGVEIEVGIPFSGVGVLEGRVEQVLEPRQLLRLRPAQRSRGSLGVSRLLRVDVPRPRPESQHDRWT